MSRMRVSLLAAGVALAVLALGAVLAFGGFATGRDGDQGPPVDQSQVKISNAQAKAAATKTVSGSVQATQLKDEDGLAAYDVTVKQADGRFVTVVVNASNGQVIRPENGADGSDDGDDG